MKNNPQQNLGFEKAPKTEIDGVLQAYLLTTQQAVASASRALFPIVDQEMRRMAQVEAARRVMPVVEAAPTPVRPTASELLAQAAATQQDQAPTPVVGENLLTESTDAESDIASHLRAVDAIHAEIEAERAQQFVDTPPTQVNSGDYGRAA